MVQLLVGLALALAVALALIGPDRLIAQVEGDRGIQPLATSTDIQVDGIEVETTGKTADEARLAGWKQAQRDGWAKLGGPAMGEGAIESMVTAVVIEREQIGPKRYIATLGVIFDRQRAGQYLGGGDGQRARSAPMLVIPILYSGGAAQVFEVRGPWQKAWAEYRASASSIDYVRPSGAGAFGPDAGHPDPLFGRRGTGIRGARTVAEGLGAVSRQCECDRLCPSLGRRRRIAADHCGAGG